ncbi:hypothetical protein CS390_10955 [Pseudomonas sp. HLS-6]|uniref:MerR family transcriptional regulator n=1 Tax=Pseudomonas sp. HLS-6 TaxID=2049589 RepID=UPI000C1A33F9|nr:MerR family transcriptional regulator [Pseudomonas sp. HLS-6]ATR83031.1 hypothetical protein CS390_10955 [Pseudomonas sp. HLS-6]
MIGEPIPDPRHQILADLNAKIDRFFADGGQVTVGKPFEYVPRPQAQFNNQLPVGERKAAALKHRDEEARRIEQIREMAKTMTYNEAARATGYSTATLHRIAKQGGFLFKVSTARRGKGRAIDRVADAAKLEQLKALRNGGLSRYQASKQMGISDKLLDRLISDYEIDFPARPISSRAKHDQ